MSKTFHSDVADFTTNSGTANLSYIYNTVSPSIAIDNGEYIIKDQTSLDNFALTFYFRFASVANNNMRVHLGSDGTGLGNCLNLSLDASKNATLTYGELTTPGWINAIDTSIKQRQYLINNGWNVQNPTYVQRWTKVSIVIVNDILEIYYDNLLFYKDESYTPVGTYFGFSNNSSVSTYISDVYVYENQIFYGNVNIDGTIYSSGGYVNAYYLHDMSLYKRVECDSQGRYALFIEDDPLNLNKYYIIGYYNSRADVQPRGVSNLYVQ